MVAGAQEPGSLSRSWSHGDLPCGWESHAEDVATASNAVRGREGRTNALASLSPVLPSPTGVQLPEGRGQRSGMQNRAG